ncbi:NAD-dependent epimerase/dehydratase family protein [Ramlibacter tataouinensis]|uniref:UDP-galactose 4-epimerase n=1 Tax=Ramlibacter tataouinensis (strain ATCC BAA-407 / DSM 14655 / LMG 21543 / TTB310) TaxID=365046 RepID=F5Y200_RAMTT|nr:SDR family oxidoreductase [Ramlibacter tataouinensis]AEG93584.1 UDP- galactose 4-epimerase [Ramlibacter tataouinensis TTB310]
MKLLVTGVEGYIGCLLAPYLQQRGHDLVGLDTGYYRDGWLFSDRALVPGFPRTVNRDIRQIEAKDLEGVDAVVHMAELSNDPLGENDPDLTFQINHQASVRLAQLAKEAGVRRFVYTSSCSVYGVADGAEPMTEQSPTNPQTAYAKCKTLVERDVAPMASAGFSPTFLRNATAYGASPRMRFDIVLNNLCGIAATTGRIVMTSDGTPWRPLVHVLDICQAIACALEAPRDAVHGEIFNVGHDADNYQVREIAQIVAGVYPGCELSFGQAGADNRSYKVSFAKIRDRLPGFACQWDARKGARQLHGIFERIGLDAAVFDARPFTRLKQLKYLSGTGQLDERLFWTC